MTKDDKKKTILITVIIVIIAIAISLAIYFIIKNRNKDSSTNFIQQNSLTTSNQSIDLGNTTVSETVGYVYAISSNVSLKGVESFVEKTNSSMKTTTQEEGRHYEWGVDEDYVIYTLDKNYLIFEIAQGITWNESSLTAYSFSQFVNQYFGKSWTYTLVDSQKMSSGEIIYYAKRNIDNINIETVFDKQQTDYLALKNGKIVYGKILLLDIMAEKKEVPLVADEELERYINLPAYPKEIYPNYNAVQSTVLSDIDYKSDEFAAITETLSDCKSNSAELVYLYKYMEQKNLTPVFKLDLNCEITFEDKKLSVPAIGYVSAIDPKYISAE